MKKKQIMALFNKINYTEKRKKRKSGVTVSTTSKTVRLPHELFSDIDNLTVQRFNDNKQGTHSSPNMSETIIYLIKVGLENI